MPYQLLQRDSPLKGISGRQGWGKDEQVGRPWIFDNTSCLVLPRIGEGRRDEAEARCAGKRIDELSRDDLPPCVGERVSFMSPFPLTRTMNHPYAEIYPETHGHVAPTRIVHPAYSAACAPFRWMLRENVEGNAREKTIGIAERLQLGWVPDREPDIRSRAGKEVETAWAGGKSTRDARHFLRRAPPRRVPVLLLCQAHAALGAIAAGHPRRGPGSLDRRRHRIRLHDQNARPPVSALGAEYRPLGSPGFEDGFLFPYREALALAEQEGVDPEQFVAFAPDEHFAEYS